MSEFWVETGPLFIESTGTIQLPDGTDLMDRLKAIEERLAELESMPNIDRAVVQALHKSHQDLRRFANG